MVRRLVAAQHSLTAEQHSALVVLLRNPPKATWRMPPCYLCKYKPWCDIYIYIHPSINIFMYIFVTLRNGIVYPFLPIFKSMASHYHFPPAICSGDKAIYRASADVPDFHYETKQDSCNTLIT
jgi:hypothetical protein